MHARSFLAPGEDSPALIALPGNDGNSTLVYAVRGGALQHRVDHADVRQEQGMATSMCLAAASREEEETGTAPSFPAALGGVLLFSGYEDGSVILWRMEAGRGEKLTVVKVRAVGVPPWPRNKP